MNLVTNFGRFVFEPWRRSATAIEYGGAAGCNF